MTLPIAPLVSASELRRGLWTWVVLSLLGAGVVALPDDDVRIFSFSSGHGPSLLDAVGIVLLIGGWIAFVFPMWRARSLIPHRGVLGGFAVIAAGLTAWSVATDTGVWWMLGTGILAILQLAAAVSAMRRLSDRTG